MTVVPMRKKCPVCHKEYNWNPDVGNIKCPYCHGLKKTTRGIFGKIFKMKKATDNELDNEKK